MKHFRIKLTYKEPMMADAVYKGEDEETVRVEFVEYAQSRGMEDVEIVEIEEVSEEDVKEFMKSMLPPEGRVLQ